jgi:hypothetical protein
LRVSIVHVVEKIFCSKAYAATPLPHPLLIHLREDEVIWMLSDLAGTLNGPW